MSTVFVGTERFELIRRLGEGGFGIVYEAFDRKRSARVALKLLRQAEGRALYRFKREFRALADISHRNLVALDELLTDGWNWFFTMELVRGVPLVAYARPAAEPSDADGAGSDEPMASLDEARLRFALPQLAGALTAIHRLGIVHCDIKPSNVLVTPEGRVVVLDFGLVSEQRPIESADSLSVEWPIGELVVLGTPAYMAPEQAACEPATPAVDWYSVGVMLYQALTGELPYSGSHLDVIEAKQRGRPRSPRDLNPQAPEDLAALCMTLLDPDPAQRPSAQAILQQLGSVPPLLSQSGLMPARGLVGREDHLERLRAAFEAAMYGETVVAFVSGESGMGKTALIRRFLHDIQSEEPGLVALTSRCYERESMPYKAIDPLIDALGQHLQRLRDIDVARLVPRDVAMLARLFPVLMGVEEVRRSAEHVLEILDSLTVRQRAAGVLREVLLALTDSAPVVLVIDDAQWGDADSAAILQEMLRQPAAPPLLLIVAYRSEDTGESRLLRVLDKSIRDSSGLRVCDIEVGALEHAQARELARRLIAGGAASGAQAEQIAVESRGNAFFVHELAQHAVNVGSTTSLDAVVLERVRALPDAARRVITAVALSVQSIPADVALLAAGLKPEDGDPVQLLRSVRLVRGRSGDPALEAYHDRIREAVASQVRGASLKGWHQRLAAAWEGSGRARPETLLAHFLAAGDEFRTIHYAAAAAEKAQEALAFDRAADFYGLLVRLESDSSAQRQWLVRLGDALASAGRGYEASAAYLRALDQTTSDDGQIELERRAASELIRAGYIDEATDVLNRLLPRVGVRPPRSDVQALISTIGYHVLLAIRGTGFRERPEAQIAPDDLRRIDVLMSISAPLCFCSLLRGVALTVQATWHALRAGEPRRAVTCLASLAASVALGGTRTERRARKLIRQAQALAVPLNDPWATGHTILVEGLSLKVSGYWKQGVERLEKAIEIFATGTGVRWEIETAQTSLHDALYWMGEWGRLAREVPARRQAAEQRGDLYSATHVAARLSPVMHMAADRIDQARAEAEAGLAHWTKRHFHLQHRFAVCTGIDLDLYTGDADAASRRLAAAWPALRGILFVFQNGRIEMLFYRARIALALAAAGRRDALGRAGDDARRLDRERAPWASALAQLVRATLLRAGGNARGAASALESAEAALRRCDMNLYAAAAGYRRGQLLGGDTGRGLIENACSTIRDQQVVNPVRLVELLAPGPW